MFHWRRKPASSRGIICGANDAQEWLLPWWWERYTACNSLPVTFVDFGMTPAGKAWCTARGECLSLELNEAFITPKEEVDPHLRQKWKEIYVRDVWAGRRAWFYKPFALLLSPYEEGLWLDLDCEILKPLDPLFGRCDVASQLALCRDHDNNHLPRFDPGVRYNSGVLAFVHGAPIIQRWAEAAFFHNAHFWGDDVILTDVIRRERLAVVELEEEYNWFPTRGVHLEATIVHWVGMGKEHIKHYGGIKQTIAEFRALLR